MEINAATVWLGVIFFVGSQAPSAKKKICELSTEEIARNYGQCHPSNNKKTIKFGMRIINGAYPFKFPLKAVKFQT